VLQVRQRPRALKAIAIDGQSDESKQNTPDAGTELQAQTTSSTKEAAADGGQTPNAAESPAQTSEVDPSSMASLDGRYANTRSAQVLIGGLVSSPCSLVDTDGRLGIFYAFPDLSIRTEGSFRIRFNLYRLG
jgi:hypothetical protein